MVPTHIEKGLAMDKSIRLPLVLGELKVPASELDIEEWFGLITYALELCRHQTKYFPGFQSVEQISLDLPRSRSKGFQVVSGNTLVNLSDQPRCIRLTKAEGQRGHGGSEDILLLTQKSEILHWRRSFVWEGPFNTGVFSEQLWRFQYLHGHDLKEYLSPGVGIAILKSLTVAAGQAHENRLTHAESMRTLRDTLSSFSAKFA